MSTKTTFKRIALVAVAALGLGVLSVAPSSATAGAVSFTTTAGSASVTQGAQFETSTAATVNITGLLSSSSDTYSVTVIQKSSSLKGNAFRLAVAETSTSVNSKVLQSAATASTLAAVSADVTPFGYRSAAGVAASAVTLFESTTVTSASYQIGATNASYVGATFGLVLDSNTSRTAGTYTFTVLVQPFEANVLKANSLQTVDITFTVTDTAANVAAVNGTIDPSKTTAVLNAGSSITTTTDSSVAVVATASATNHATIQVKTFTSASLAAPESVTVTLTGAGVVCNSDGSICGNNLTIAGDGDDLFRVRANGTAGTASIVVKTTTKTFPAKTVAFFAKSPATITVSTNKPVISVAAATAQTDVVRAVATDANGIVWGGQLYVIANAAADALIAGSTTPVACTFDSVNNRHACPVGGTAAGTAALKVMDASLDTDGTIATTDAAVTSATTSSRVSTAAAATATITFDKATYGPGEKATVLIRALDADGLALPLSTITAAFTAAPTTNVAFSAGSDTLLADIAISADNSSTSFRTAGAKQYTVYMPMSSGTVTISATGSTGLAQAGRVVVTGSAEVVNSSVDAATDAANEATDAANAATDAALAAADAADAATAAAEDASAAVVTLAASVSTALGNLKKQISALTALVNKLLKKK